MCSLKYIYRYINWEPAVRSLMCTSIKGITVHGESEFYKKSLQMKLFMRKNFIEHFCKSHLNCDDIALRLAERRLAPLMFVSH